ICLYFFYFFFFQAEDGIRDKLVTGVQTCALPISNYFPAEVVARKFEFLAGRQSITFPEIQTNGVPQLHATASSGLPVEYEVVQGAAVIVGNSVTEIGEGPITVRARQPGNVLYGPAIPVDRTFIIRLIGQSIVLEKVPDVIMGDGEGGAREMLGKSSVQPGTNNLVRLRAFATSGLPVSYMLLPGPAILTGNVV